MALPSTTLYFRDGSSDKVYQCAIEASGSGFLVNFAFGRRGGSLQAGTKTTTPVDMAKAQKLFDKLVQEKSAKGYTQGRDGTPYTASTCARKSTGYVPQLLNMIEELEVRALLQDRQHVAQEKMDGERQIVIKLPGQDLLAANKQGLGKALVATVAADMALLPRHVVLDGEAIGDNYFVFDLLELQGSIQHLPYSDRYATLKSLLAHTPGLTAIRLVELAATPAEKQALYTKLETEGREGIVFKQAAAQYVSGRPASGGAQLKFKFYATASCRVAGVNDKRSVSLEVLDGTDPRDVSPSWVNVGNVTIPPNKAIPAKGALAEIRYLYAYRGGSLFQSIYLGQRDDIDEAECTAAQLKYKST